MPQLNLPRNAFEDLRQKILHEKIKKQPTPSDSYSEMNSDQARNSIEQSEE